MLRGRGFPYLKNVSKCLGFLVSCFLGFLVSWFLWFLCFLLFLVSKFQSILVSKFLGSWFQSSLVSWYQRFNDPILSNSHFMFSGRYLSHTQDFQDHLRRIFMFGARLLPFHVFWKIFIPYPRFSRPFKTDLHVRCPPFP